MNRHELDAFVQRQALPRAAIEAAFEHTHARPSATETGGFFSKLLRLSGVLSFAAGMVFFIAANWDAFAVLGRFALLQGVLVVCIAAALWRPPPLPLGRYALLLAFIATGSLLALFGQTYQTGADVYELFLTWAVLGLAIVVAGQWSVTWAAWALVLNVALLLFCGFLPESGWLFILFFGWGLRPSELLVLATAANLLLWLATLALAHTVTSLAPRWLGRFVLACAVGFGTTAGAIVIVDNDSSWSAVLLLAALVGVAAHTLRRRDDVFPLALLAASAIGLTSVAIGAHGDLAALELFFALSLWLIVSSTLSGHWLMKAVRAWRTDALAP